MAKKTFEMMFQIGGKLAGSFSGAFSGAKRGLTDLKNESRQTQRALDQLGNDFRRGKIDQTQYAEATARLTRELNRLQNAQERVNNAQARMQKFQSSLTNGLNAAKQVAGIAALGTAAAATGTAFNSINKAMDFEAQLDSIQAVTGITEQQLKTVRASALENGAATKYSALEAAQGFEELLKAGMSLEAALDGGLNSSLNLASAGGLELAESATYIADALNGFKKDGMSAAEVANILSGAANASSSDVRDMGYGLSAVGPVADGLGISFKEVNAILAMFSNNSLKGSDAGTSFKTMLSNLVPKTEAATEAFMKFGIINSKGQNTLFDSNGELKDMSEVAGILQKSFRHLNAEQRQSVFYTMFGSDAIRAANIVFKEGAEGVQKMYDEMSKVTALDVAKQKMDNAKGAVEQLQGAFETMQIVGAEALNPVIKKSALGLADMLVENEEAIERFGQKVASAAEDIFEPFSTRKPVFDATNKDPEYIAQYNKELLKFNKFNGMDFGDKIVYMLDQGSAKMEEWLSGSGGESMNKIFTKLGEIAAKAWWNAFTGAIKSSVSNLAEGNVAAGVGMGAAAWMLGGGLLVKGAMSTGGMVAKGVRGRKTAAPSTATITPTTPTVTTRNTSNRAPATTSALVNRNRVPATATGSGNVVRSAANTGLKSFGSKALKLAGKAALPLAAVGTVVDIVRSKDKAKATAEGVGGLAASLGGAKVGAAIGTAIAPGIGTAIGGFLGGVGGFIAGKWLGGKAVDTARGSGSSPQTLTQTSTQKASEITTTELDSAIALSAQNFRSLAINTAQAVVGVVSGFNGINSASTLTTHNLNALTMWTGQASGWMVGSFMGIKSSADRVKGNLDILYSYTAQASGWLASLNSIQSAGKRVEQALDDLATRINNVQVPNVGRSKRLSYE